MTRRDDLVLHVDLPTTPGPPRGGAGASVHDALEAAMPGLDHVAILVKDLDAAIALYRDVYGLTLDEVEDVPTEKVRVAIFGRGAGRIELVCPTDPGSPLAKRIAEKGEGLHHICLAVPDIAEAMDALRARGAPLLDERPRPGAGGSQVAFVHPKGSRGVLVELKQGGSGH